MRVVGAEGFRRWLTASPYADAVTMPNSGAEALLGAEFGSVCSA